MCDETGFVWPASLAEHRLEPAEEDDALAAAARSHYRSGAGSTISSSGDVRAALKPDEQLIAVRTTASIDPGPRGGQVWSGQLVVTNERLVLIDQRAVTLASFDQIEDVTLAADRVLVVLTTGGGFAIRSCHPRLLRVQLAAARARGTDH
jgi:hypothetical protein